jgi:23S rRNA pseudouridine2605 synthase
MGERIAKRLAGAGLCSRREAERWVEEGRVAVNGKTLTTPACVVEEHDLIEVDGKKLHLKPPVRLWLYHKPPGLVTTQRDPQGRATVFDELPKSMGRVVSVGRLDLNSEGLLLLTNSGELQRHLELPKTGLRRTYRARVFGDMDVPALMNLKNGITYEGITYGPMDVVVEKNEGRNGWLLISLHEGKNREVRQVMRAVGLAVNRLIRFSYGPFELGTLKRGEVIEVNAADIAKVWPSS